MTMTWDLTDVPAVATADLAAAMQSLVDAGRGLVLHRGVEDKDLDVVQALIKTRFHGDPERGLALFLRFRHLAEVFGARRLKDMIMDHGYTLLAPAVAVAASMRLNANRGFSPQGFLTSLTGALASNVVTLADLRKAPAVAEELPLAA